jgi:large subunit ribosomal protein L20
MVRSGSPKTQAARRRRTRKLTKGFRLSRHNLFRQSLVTLIRARAFAFRDRRAKKRNFRRLWIVRINAACRMRGLRYSEFIHGLQRALVALDRKSLSEIAIHDPATFDKLAEIARANLPKPQAAAAK